MNETKTAGLLSPASAQEGAPPSAEEPKNPLLVALGERVRNLRAQRGLTRKAVAVAADVSERHLANLEYGTGNASILCCSRWPMPCTARWQSWWATSRRNRPNGC